MAARRCRVASGPPTPTEGNARSRSVPNRNASGEQSASTQRRPVLGALDRWTALDQADTPFVVGITEVQMVHAGLGGHPLAADRSGVKEFQFACGRQLRHVQPRNMAARDSVARSPLCITPSSRKCTWSAIIRGISARPAASITEALSGALIAAPMRSIRPSKTSRSPTWTCPSMTRPALVNSSDRLVSRSPCLSRYAVPGKPHPGRSVHAPPSGLPQRSHRAGRCA